MKQNRVIKKGLVFGTILLLVLVVFMGMTMNVGAHISSLVSEEWIRRYDGPVNGADYGTAMDLDSSGNVYVTGYGEGSGTDHDFVTIAYDLDGDVLWTKRYNGPTGNGDYANAIVVDDSSGNVYVTGHSRSTGVFTDYATVAYNSDGTELWTARYDGPPGKGDVPVAIAVDEGSGNVYVTGHSFSSTTYYDCTTVAYDSDGDLLWVARYHEIGADFGTAIAVDQISGDIYVTGWSFGSGTNHDIATVAYDSDGTQLWVKRYNGPADGSDEGNAIAVDSSGNVYVTGISSSYGTYSNLDYYTIAYESDGDLLWSARYNGPGNYTDTAWDLAIDDSSGVVYITGWSKGDGTDYDQTTIAYDSSGNELWVARFNGPANGIDIGLAIVVDSVGNVLVNGYISTAGADKDFSTIGYTPGGDEFWIKTYNGPDDGRDYGNAIVVDTSGNVWVSGYSYGGSSTDYDFVTIKYTYPTTPEEAIEGLIVMVENLNLPNGLENSLTKKLENALEKLESNNENAAINQLNAFINHVEAQSGKKIDEDDAEELVTLTENIVTMIEANM